MKAPRDRIVLFRLTESEYRSVNHAMREAQARCLSEFVRDRVLAATGPEQRLERIEGTLEWIAGYLGRKTEVA